MRIKLTATLLCSAILCLLAEAKAQPADTLSITSFDVTPNSRLNSSAAIQKAIEKAKEMNGNPVVISFPKGRYDFYQFDAVKREYYISNHDQDNPKTVGIPLEGLSNVTIDGNGSEFIFHGRMLPVALVGGSSCELKNFSIDFDVPLIQQIQILENDTTARMITFKVDPSVRYEIENRIFYAYGEGWKWSPRSGIAFEKDTKRIVYNTGDIATPLRDVEEISPRVIRAKNWYNPKLVPGTFVACRQWFRPAPGIFLSHNLNTRLTNIQVHFAEGMGLLAQLCENIYMDKFSVCLKGDSDPRCFTTQADATHFSGCKGEIISKNGLYEGMMDDAINVHGTYLKISKRINDNTVIADYMHEQSWGFEWGRLGDKVQFIRSNTMEIAGKETTILSIKPADTPTLKGVKQFEISFADPIAAEISEKEGYGIENLTWTPEVTFSNNVIRNNRARGTLFSTPKRTVVENNIFDHTSGSAILLCGDCNGWYETGACREVIIRNNHFINALTSYYQFTSAVISIYPEIPDLKNQKQYFHSGIVIENNTFETFDMPLVYAKSVNGLIFRNNTVKHNTEYKPFHNNRYPFLFERVTNYKFEKNTFDGKKLNPKTDLKLNN